MDVSVHDAAQQLGRHPSEVRRLLAAGTLRGRHMGHQWIVDGADLARIQQQVRRPGRAMAPARAWALLWLLDGSDPDWVTAVARSQIRARLPELAGASADQWRSLLRTRAEMVRCEAHPAAIVRLQSHADAVVASGPDQAGTQGIDLVVIDALPEVYVRRDRWLDLSAQLHVRPTHGAWNCTVRLPSLWPFHGTASAAVVSADLLDSAEPRAVAAGAQKLRELAEAKVQ